MADMAFGINDMMQKNLASVHDREFDDRETLSRLSWRFHSNDKKLRRHLTNSFCAILLVSSTFKCIFQLRQLYILQPYANAD